MSGYVPLWVKTNHSFLSGASFPDELAERARELGLGALAVTDRDGVYGLVRAHVAARQRGLELIAGAEVTLEGGGRLLLLARDRGGYGRLCGLLTAGHARAPKGQSMVSLEEVAAHAQGLVALCPEPGQLGQLRDAFGEHLFALAVRHLEPDDRAREAALRAEARAAGAGVAGAVEVLYHHRARRPLQDVLTCIRHGRALAEAGCITRPNAEHDLKSAGEMAALFADAPELLAATREVADRCAFRLSDLRYRYPAEELPDGRSESDWLRELTMRGAASRYRGHIPADVRAQLQRELDLIAELDYGGYFLTMHEVVRYCVANGILCQGRGSAANSAVCFCLGITAIDPVRMDLLFERFLSRERAEPPDIDLDIEHDRREEVIAHVYERWGRRRAAMVANVIRYRTKSAIREVGKALGVATTDIEAVARLAGHHGGGLDEALLAAAGLDASSPLSVAWMRLVREIQEFPRHLSIHPGGFLLGHEPVDTLVPIEPATMEGRTVIQWDKYDVEDLGLFKVDLLGLGALTAVHGCFDLMKKHDGIELDMAGIPAEDPATYDMISAGDTVGVFQIESRAQMAMLPRLKPRTFYDLVIEVAIVRPGPIQGNMVHPYLRRRAGEEEVEYPHPTLSRVLKKTLGVPIFQEQVMKLAVLAAGYTPGESDQLRRDMAAWRRSGRIEAHRERLVGRMVANGIPLEFAERVFSQIKGFGEYGFPESHAASFALLAYVTAWLHRHHPAVFLCAMLNAQPMGFYSASTLCEDGRHHGVEVRPIDVRHSAWDCTLEPGERGHAVRIGLRYVKGLGERDRKAIEAAPPFDDLDGFVRGTGLSLASLLALAEAGALDGFVPERRDALWQVRALAEAARDPLPLGADGSSASFRPLGRFEQVGWDFRRTGMSPRGHPMAAFRDELRGRRFPEAAEVREMKDGRRIQYAGMVICRQRPGTASGVTFFTLEDETGFVNVVVWKQVFERFAVVAKTASLLAVQGRLQVAEGVTHLVADRLWVPRLGNAPAVPKSRDFH